MGEGDDLFECNDAKDGADPFVSTEREGRPNNYSSETLRWRNGDETKPNPLFILVLNNIAIERPLGSGNYQPDFATGDFNNRKAFSDLAEYAVRNLLGRLPGQTELLLSDSPHAAKIRIWSMYVWGLVANGATCLAGEDGTQGSTVISPRRAAVQRMLAYLGLDPDIVFVVSKSPTHDRASAYGTTDDDARGGVTIPYKAGALTQRYHHRIPGMATLHVTSRGQTPAHEFGHAFSSYSNGFVTDLYVDGSAAFNREVGRPIPNAFCAYNHRNYLSDRVRDGLGYPGTWTSYHAELLDATRPALMDNYWLAQGGPLTVRHDALTKAYILDRIAAKVSR